MKERIVVKKSDSKAISVKVSLSQFYKMTMKTKVKKRTLIVAHHSVWTR